MKSLVIKILHTLFGYERYLYLFSIFKISTLRFFRKKWDYLYFVKQRKPDDNVVVIGASIGITTIPFARQCKKGLIFAYEPMEDNFVTINKLIKHYRVHNCSVYKMAMGAVNEKNREMHLPRIRGVKKHGMAQLNIDGNNAHSNYLSQLTEVSRLDDREELSDVSIDAIKLIAENSEYEILLGAEQTIRKNKPEIYCELWDNEKRDRTIQLIESYGYQVFFRNNRKLIPNKKGQYRKRNLFFLPTDE